MTTRDIGIVLHEEVDRRQKLIDQLVDERDAILKTLEVIERPTPEAQHRVTRVVGRRRGRPPESSTKVDTANHCGKHPGAMQTKDGRCRECIGDAMRASHARRKKEQAKPPAEPKTEGSAMVKCLQCGDRFPDAKSLGIHQTRTHFGNGSAIGSSLANI